MTTLAKPNNRNTEILRFLAEIGRPARISEVADAIGKPLPYTAAYLGYLKRSGRASNPKRGFWSLADGGAETAKRINRGSTLVPRVTYPVELVSRDQFLVRLCSTARKRRECDIEFTDLIGLWEQQQGRCALSRLPMTMIRGLNYQVPTNCSLDRIDSAAGYTKENVQLVCWIVNVMKQQLTNEQVLVFMSAITAFRDVESLPEEVGAIERDWETQN